MIQKVVNNQRNLHDSRNAEALKHVDHELMLVRERYVSHPTQSGFKEIQFICLDCNAGFRAYLWEDIED